MRLKKNIALVAHDQRKQDLLEWVKFNDDKLAGHHLFATGTTGKLISDHTRLEVKHLKSGPLGGDQQLGAMIADLKLDILIFFWDPMTAQPHDVDVKALLRMSVLYNVAGILGPIHFGFRQYSLLLLRNTGNELSVPPMLTLMSP
jgi:methylglyoxal synthase